MYHLPITKWSHQMHVPSRHDMVVGLDHMVHNERFWGIVGLLAIVAVLVALIMLAEPGAGPPGDTTPIYPYFP
jgi:hypothetical protein